MISLYYCITHDSWLRRLDTCSQLPPSESLQSRAYHRSGLCLRFRHGQAALGKFNSFECYHVTPLPLDHRNSAWKSWENHQKSAALDDRSTSHSVAALSHSLPSADLARTRSKATFSARLGRCTCSSSRITSQTSNSSLGWFKGKSTGNHCFYHEIWGFPVNFPIIQFYE